MGRVQRAGDLHGDLQRLIELQPAFLEAGGERLAFEVLDHEVRDIILLADVEERADVRMTQRRNEPGFAVEALPELRFAGERGRQNLDGDDPIEARVTGAIDLAHAARADRGLDLVRSQTGARIECQGGDYMGSRGVSRRRAHDQTPGKPRRHEQVVGAGDDDALDALQPLDERHPFLGSENEHAGRESVGDDGALR